MKQAYSVRKVFDAKFKTAEFDGEWLAAVGYPEMTGSWCIGGMPKNGKTSFALKLAKYLTKFGRVAYDSVEEGLTKSFQNAMLRAGMGEASGKFMLLDREPIEELTARLKKPKSPQIIFIDSIQFAELNFQTYKKMKKEFPNKLFIYITHLKGARPHGDSAIKIWRDSSVIWNVEGFRAFPTSRYGGGEPIDVSAGMAQKYWGKIN
ncbi:MAG: hypothetical protein LBS50_05275 [Prevotellaceae bacterium]|jgi:hypothetical protein|nr:hypothetical protein [Prevotellaceae bacterium]